MLLSVWRFAKFGAVRVLVNLYIPRRFGKIASGRTCFARFKSKLLGVFDASVLVLTALNGCHENLLMVGWCCLHLTGSG